MAPTASPCRPLRALVALSAVLALTSCVGHTHRVGLGPTGIGEESTRQFYIFFGLLSVNELDMQRMTDNLTSYSIDTEFSFVDLLLLPLLLPFTATSRTVTVRK